MAFVMLFLDNYFPNFEQEALRTEFSTFKWAKDMTVSEYPAKFSRLARFAPLIVLIEVEKAIKFQLGLLPQVGGKFASDRFLTFAQVIHKVRQSEKHNIMTKKNHEASVGTMSYSGPAGKSHAKIRRMDRLSQLPLEDASLQTGRATNVSSLDISRGIAHFSLGLYCKLFPPLHPSRTQMDHHHPVQHI